MGEIEAVADAITGSVLGRAAEPPAGEAAGHTRETKCLNCGTGLVGPHCHRCGQQAHVHRSLAAFFHDFAHGVFHLEGKLWRTIPLLAWKPGELTRRYIEGQRASFVSPIALFLFCVFLMFGVVEWTGGIGQAPASPKANLAQHISLDQRKLAELQSRKAAAAKAGQPSSDIDQAISATQDEIAALQTGRGNLAASNIQFAKGTPNILRKMFARAKENPDLLFFKIKTNAYKFSWALIPISVPFVWLLFPFSRRFQLYDHTVFVTYSLCFMMLLLSFGTLVGLVSNALASFCWFVPPVHMYRQLRGAYQVSRWGATWRASLLTIFAFIAIGLFAGLLVGLGALD